MSTHARFAFALVLALAACGSDGGAPDGGADPIDAMPVNPDADAILQSHFPRPIAGFEAASLAQRGKPVQITDTENAEDAQISEAARSRGFRSMLFAPLMNSGVPIGVISVTRAMPGSFAAHHVQLLQTFADQAVIAIENTRLFNEVQARTVELTESLEQQTATSEVLSVISRSAGDLAPVFAR